MALIQKASSSTKLSEVDSMAVSGILSLQLIHQLFIKDFELKPIYLNIIKSVER